MMTLWWHHKRWLTAILFPSVFSFFWKFSLINGLPCNREHVLAKLLIGWPIRNQPPFNDARGHIYKIFSGAQILKIILACYWLKSWRALTLKWHLHCFLVWHFYENSKFFTNCNFSNFLIFIFQIFYSGKEKKKKRDMAQGFNDLLIQPMDDLYRWSSPLTQSFNFKFIIFVMKSRSVGNRFAVIE